LGYLVVVVERATEVDDPEEQQEQQRCDQRELDERCPALVAPESA
jgi:hypothetical protein